MTARKLTGNWMFFSVDGVDVLRYSIKGTYAGELDNTAELIAHDYGIDKTRVVAEARQYFDGKVVDKAVYSWDTRRFVYAKAV